MLPFKIDAGIQTQVFLKLILEHHDEKESFFNVTYHNIKAVVFSLTRMNEALSVLLGAFI